MTKRVRIAFEQDIVILPIASLLPRRKLPETQKKTVKYKVMPKQAGLDFSYSRQPW